MNKVLEQIRSWEIMRAYFGIERPGTSYVSVEWPVNIPKPTEEEIAKQNESLRKIIQLN